MNWNIAQAKQRFSEMVKQAASEPQLIYNRDTPVAAMIAAEDLAEYQVWRDRRRKRTLGEEFAELRRLAAGQPDPLPDPDRLSGMRANAFADMLNEEYPAHAAR